MYTKIVEAFVYEPYYVITFESDAGVRAKVILLYDCETQILNLLNFEEIKETNSQSQTVSNPDGYTIVPNF